MSQRPLNPSEKLDWLRLIRTDRVGPVTFYQLLSRFGSAAAALEALPELAARGGQTKNFTVYPRASAERELAAFQKAGVELVAWGEPDYPPALAAVEDAPPLLTTIGDKRLLTRHAVALVGARNASANGRRLAREIAAELGQKGILVVSGFARGIDAAAHDGSIDTGTLAVMAGGIDVIYPEENRSLYEAILKRGVLVAEAPLGIEPQARHFPRRNRIISGISLGVVVVEAALRSGSLITARFALDQGREVFAVPGSPLDPRCRGANDLIRGGAILTESAEDIIRELSDQLAGSLMDSRKDRYRGEMLGPPGDKELQPARVMIEERLSPTPVPVDELIRQCQFSPAIVVTVLLELELAGRLERHPGNQVSLL